MPRIRVVGGPQHSGEWLRDKFKCVDYLGPLSDEDARLEAATWTAFLHPIFCAARGCSTKLAGAIGWGLPIVTTELGHRGYVWREGSLLIGNTPAEFAERCLEVINAHTASEARAEVLRVLASSPSSEEAAAMILRFMGNVGMGVRH